MLLVLGSALDDQPLALVERWTQAGRDVALATPADLSRSGWRLRSGRPDQARAAVGERLVEAGEIDAIVTLLPWVSPADLGHVAKADRDYVAHEMSAFLLAWLTELRCTVVDRPSTVSLSGCGRSGHEWAALARPLGIACEPTWTGPCTAVTVVAGHAVGDIDPELALPAEALAAQAARNLITFRFAAETPGSPTSTRPLIGACVRAEIGSMAAADALLRWLERS